MQFKKLILVLFVLALGAGAALAQTPVVTSGWEAFVIRENASEGAPLIEYNDAYGEVALEFVTFAASQKAGLGTNQINGATLSQIATLHVDRLDDPSGSGSEYGPYFNIWVTDGAGQYAVISNEPSDGEWAGSRWDVADWDFLRTKRAKVFEVPGASGGNPGSSWVATYAQANGWDGSSPLVFDDIGGLVIAPPPAAYIQNPANAVGSGAPDELGTDIAYGYNWIFGDTMANYVSGDEGFVVNNYYATTVYNVANTTQGTTYATIEAALAAANPGDNITVADGTYNPPNTLSFSQSLTLNGASQAGTIINIPAAGGYGIRITASNVTLGNFTLQCDAANENYPIHASGTSNPPGGFDNLAISNVTIQGAHKRTGFDIHGFNNVDLSGLVSTDAWGGNGLQVTGCVDVDMDNITCADNAWGSIAIYCSNDSYLGRPSSDVVIDGTTLVADGAVFSQDEFGYFNTGVVVTGWDYTVRNTRFREALGYSDSEGYTFFAADQAAATAVALGFTGYEQYSSMRNLTLDVLEVYAGMSIQAAIDAAAADDDISVGPGHFEEQLHVTTEGLSLTGSGVDVTYVDSPATLPLFYTSGINQNKPVVFVEGVADFALSQLTVDGLGRGNANVRFIGIAYYNAGGDITNVDVDNIMDTPFSGVQHGVGVYCYADDGGPYDFDMTTVNVDLFQKTAVAVYGAGITSDMSYVTTTGAGATTVTAQNGIQAGGEALVNASYCMITGMAYTGGNWSASGFLASGNAVLNMNHCTVDGCQTSVYFSEGNGSFNNSTVQNPLGDAMYAYSSGAKARGTGDRPLPAQPFDGEGSRSAKSTIVVSINGSTFTGTGAVDSWGPSAYGYGPVDFTINNSTVTNWDWGVVLYDFGGAVFTGSGAGNSLSGNVSYGAYSNGAGSYDLRNNNWGDTSGPYHPGKNPGGAGDTVSDNIDFTPWTGRTTSSVADLAFGPSYPVMGDLGYGYWEGTPAIGVTDDYAAGFAPGALQAPNAYVKYGFAPEIVFGRPVNVGELYSITYHTKKDTDHVADAADWFLQMYTMPYDGSPGSTWYGNRINSEPYFSENLTETPGEWTQWNTDEGDNNRLRWFDSSSGYYGSYTDGFLDDLANDPVYTAQPIMLFGTGLGTAWAASFDGLVDGMTIELVSGETVTINFMPGEGAATVAPASSGPVACGEEVTLTFNLNTDDATPDVFGFNAVVRASAELDLGATITSLDAFGNSTLFSTFDNGDGTYLISDATIGGSPQPISGAGTTGLFQITFTTYSQGTATVTFDEFELRDSANQPIGATATGATIDIDCTAPVAVTDITATPAPTSSDNGVEVTWAIADNSDVDHYEVWRAVWHTGDNVTSAYPEYDDVNPNEPVRAASYAALGTSPEWTMLPDEVPGTATSYTDTDAAMARGVYYYEIIPVDAVDNIGPLAEANDRATSYYLGDFDGNGEVEGTGDLSPFGAMFGLTSASGSWNNIIDIGPTDTNLGLGIPETDNVVNFEDLMIFSLNYGVFDNGTKRDIEIGTTADLAWVTYGEGHYGLRLVDASGLQGVRLQASLPEGVEITVTEGELLSAQGQPVFMRNLGTGLDVNLSILGSNTAFTGQGDLVVVESSVPLTPEDLVFDLRGSDNSRVEVNLTTETGTLTPRVFGLYPNFPNPFNPQTQISFSLPEEQAVRLSVYGIDGKLVRQLVNETRGAGLHEVIWDGRSDDGRVQASGLYFYRIEAGPYSQVRKMTLMK